MSAAVLLLKMARLKISHIRHTIISMHRNTTVMPVLSQLLSNRLIGKEFSSGATVLTRLKREDYKLPTHNIVFTPWQALAEHKLILHIQILIDFSDFNYGKGVRRYRHEHLPPKHCAGLYELGVALTGQDLRQGFDPVDVLATYLGHSVDVRSRLQEYGRSGGHLAYALYKAISSEQGSILFRYALWEAAAAERMLLRIVDYPLNRCNNGTRREVEVTKLCDPKFMSKRKSQVLDPFLEDQVVTRIKEENHLVNRSKLTHTFQICSVGLLLVFTCIVSVSNLYKAQLLTEIV
ncbi:LOW QUALITY PROTEIN: protein EFFECTOR OF TRANSCRIPTION 3 [Capsella rubella]|uniref:LOW QUALITY PROTEIN: protein EFFECTOR OF TRANSCRIPTION 3 n=1 Tax=Capsella rubella TaxID=81985 RepID=UPI000CD49E5D|nr:LOW QUALITY PROTEIN: protein EFFECTOR OF TRANSCRIPTION 3 [Capsella rubella]